MHLHICKHKHQRDSCKHATYKYACIEFSPTIAHIPFSRSSELVEHFHAGFGLEFRRWTGIGSHPAMSECVSSNAFTFIAFVNYSHKDIKCKLWNRRHTRAAHASLHRYNIRWCPMYILANYSALAYDCHMQKRFEILVCRLWVPASGSRILSFLGPRIPSSLNAICRKDLWSHVRLVGSMVDSWLRNLTTWLTLAPIWFVHLQFDPTSRDQKLILLKPEALLLTSYLFVFHYLITLWPRPLEKGHSRKVARTSWEKV